MVKKIMIFTLLFFAFPFLGQAEDLMFQNQPDVIQELVTPRNVDFSACTKVYDFPVEKLFYMSILAVNANKFEIEELQSKMGYILFNGANKTFLMSVVKLENGHSMLKITPADNNYFFPYGVVYNIYKYIDMNAEEQLKILEILGNSTSSILLQQ